MDVCETKDHVLVVHHDQSLKRTCGVDKHVRDYDYKDLPRFKDEITLDFATDMKIQSNNEKMPTLQQIFQIFQGVPLNIELKTPSQTAIEEFSRLLKEYDREEITVCGIRNAEMAKFDKISPNVPKFMNDSEIFKMLCLYYTGLLPFFHIKYQTLQHPLHTQDWLNRKLAEHPDRKF